MSTFKMTLQMFTAPKPEVVHLPTLFRRIESGEIRIPQFQRRFVWKQKQIIELLESVYRGYPVGSLLFWKTDSSDLKFDQNTFGKKIANLRTPISFLLDGQQRLTSLYRCFFPNSNDRIFDVYFDLDKETFHHQDELGGDDASKLPLAAIFQPKEFLAAQQRLIGEKRGEVLADVAIRLHTRFQEYMVPAVTIEGRELSDVVEIFERINRTGTTLSAVDFMRAVTWTPGFDLNDAIAGLSKTANHAGYDVKNETIVKLIAIALGRAPIPDEMMKLRGITADELDAGVKLAKSSIRKAIAFLKKDSHLLSYDYVPYEGQFLAIARAFQMKKPPTLVALKQLSRWFWSITFSEGLRGTPDHVVAGLVQAVDDVLAGDLKALEIRSTLTEHDVVKRRFIRRKALSAGLAELFARQQARSLVTGDVIEIALYMSSFDSSHYQPLAIGGQGVGRRRSAKSLANIFLCPDSDRVALKAKSIVDHFKARGWSPREKEAILRSQLISPLAWRYLEEGEVKKFTAERARSIVAAAKACVGAKAGG